jgi:hypothetical protein
MFNSIRIMMISIHDLEKGLSEILISKIQIEKHLFSLLNNLIFLTLKEMFEFEPHSEMHEPVHVNYNFLKGYYFLAFAYILDSTCHIGFLHRLVFMSRGAFPRVGF